jgi:hypothetical protein
MRTRDMEDAQGFYNHEGEIGGLHTSMVNAKTNSNGRRDMYGDCNYEEPTKRSENI